MSGRETLHAAFVDADMAWQYGGDDTEFAEMLIDRLLALYPTFVGILDGTHVIVPKEPPQEAIERGLDILCNQSHEDNAPEIGDALEYLDLRAVYIAMVEAAQEEGAPK